VLEVVGREAQNGDQLVRDTLTAGSPAVVGFAAAAKLHGWDLPALPPPPTVILPPGARSQGIRAYRARLRDDEVALFGVVLVTVVACTAIDLASVLPVEKAVITLDSALRSGQVKLHELNAKCRERRAGIRAPRRALALTDPSAGSVAESESPPAVPQGWAAASAFTVHRGSWRSGGSAGLCLAGRSGPGGN
jgi:hypothetical protein